MKKAFIILTVVIVFLSIIMCVSTNVYAVKDEDIINQVEQPGTLIKLKESQANTLQEYQNKYGSDSYGLTAYILHLVQIYSIPFCFLGIIIGVIHQYVIGVRKLDTLEKGYGLIVTFVTILIICQVLPLAFAMFVKFGRG